MFFKVEEFEVFLRYLSGVMGLGVVGMVFGIERGRWGCLKVFLGWLRSEKDLERKEFGI